MNVPSVEDSERNGSMFGYTTWDFQTAQPDILCSMMVIRTSLPPFHAGGQVKAGNDE